MYYPLLSQRPDRLLRLFLYMLLAALSLPALASAAPDSAMQQSLTSFFKQGVVIRGAAAELIQVDRWPATRGAVRWSLPVSMRNHPKRISLIAEQNGKRWYVPVRVHWWVMAIVMTRPVPARSLLTHDMLKKTRSDIAGQNGHWLAQTADLVGMRLNRRMHQGELILARYVKRPALIKRGDLVSMILELGGLHLRTVGKAMRSAGKGERLLVKNLNSQEVVSAIAEGSGIVRVQYRGISG